MRLKFESLILVVLVCTVLICTSKAETVYVKWEQPLIPVLVDGHWNTGSDELDNILKDYNISRLSPAIQFRLKSDPLNLKHVLRLELPDCNRVNGLIEKLRMLSGTVYAERLPERQTVGIKDTQIIRNGDNVPGDPFYPEQYFFVTVDAPAAWDITRGNSEVVVAIVDNGVEWDHLDLSSNIWSNTDEIAGNSVDDDENGFVDDVRGWDFVGYDNNPTPGSTSSDSHGTHVAGIVGALMNNGLGVVGMAPECTLMPVRTGDQNEIIYGGEGIIYAAHNGANIINLSWGGSSESSFEEEAILDAQIRGVLVVAAAGNSHTSNEHWPAAYQGVMAVANTKTNDELYQTSNFGDWVDICAPGVSILSTVPDTYGYSTGTSMSTPMVAGVAALVKSVNPGWTYEQLLAQLTFTADDISTLNPNYPGLIGAGRVNAYRAVAETAPGIQIIDLSLEETSGDFDGKLDPGESADLIVSLTNSAAATSDIEITLSSAYSAVQVNQGTWFLYELGTGETVSNALTPFNLTVQSFAISDYEFNFELSIISEDFYSVTVTQPFWIDPHFLTHDEGNLAFTVTEFGAFGYTDYRSSSGEYIGSGFRFPAEGPNALYLGSLVAGVSPERVSDCAYGSTFPRYDWVVTQTGEIGVVSSGFADQEFLAVYEDTRPSEPERVGLHVIQRSYAWDDSPDDDFVILDFTLDNISGNTLNDLYVGLYLDWDVSVYNLNEAGWDSERALGYVYNQQLTSTNRRYYGETLLSHEPASFRVIDTDTITAQSFIEDEDKYRFMSEGFVQTASTHPIDQATLLSAGPFTLASDEDVQVVFAILGGDDLNDLKSNADAAHDIWGGSARTEAGLPCGETKRFTIDTVYPRPANGSLRFEFTLPGPGEVTFDLIDALGRSIQILQANYPDAGIYKAQLPSWNGSSGVYILRGTSLYGQFSTKILWLK